MSNTNGPIRRRRIAGEFKPTVEPAEIKRRLIPKAPSKAPRKPVAADPVPSTKAPLYVGVKSPPKVVPTGSPASLANLAKPARAKASLPPRTQWRWFIPLAFVALCAAVFAVVFAVRGVSDFRQQNGIEASNTKASAAAGSAAETIFSFRYDKLDEHLVASKALMTPAFTKEFDKIAPALTELAPQRKIVVQAQSRNAAALECGNECSPTKSSILVFLDQARLVGDSKVPTVFGNRIVVGMVELNGVWLVNDIRAL
ncbi:MAG: hypothetical protein H7288_00570 [Kineosporiaceae bacterium]|nr:hypothetical protein [Aeromicrobium sp.]